jgi:hypothetical protein
MSVENFLRTGPMSVETDKEIPVDGEAHGPSVVFVPEEVVQEPLVPRPEICSPGVLHVSALRARKRRAGQVQKNATA